MRKQRRINHQWNNLRIHLRTKGLKVHWILTTMERTRPMWRQSIMRSQKNRDKEKILKLWKRKEKKKGKERRKERDINNKKGHVQRNGNQSGLKFPNLQYRVLGQEQCLVNSNWMEGRLSVSFIPLNFEPFEYIIYSKNKYNVQIILLTGIFFNKCVRAYFLILSSQQFN